MGSDVGGAIKGFRKAMNDDDDKSKPPQLSDSSTSNTLNDRHSSHDHQR